jgi:DnaJ domain
MMISPSTDLYAALQVAPDAETEVIDAAYRQLMRKYHPDGAGRSSAGGTAARAGEADQPGVRHLARSATAARVRSRAAAELARCVGSSTARCSAGFFIESAGSVRPAGFEWFGRFAWFGRIARCSGVARVVRAAWAGVLVVQPGATTGLGAAGVGRAAAEPSAGRGSIGRVPPGQRRRASRPVVGSRCAAQLARLGVLPAARSL